MSRIQDFAQSLLQQQIPLPELLILLSHIICSICLCIYLYKYRKCNPIMQNSPWITILAQIMLAIASLGLFLGKLLQRIEETENSQGNGRWEGKVEDTELWEGSGSNASFCRLGNFMSQINRQCYCQQDPYRVPMLTCYFVYLFAMEFVIVAYFLKMIRVLVICVQVKQLQVNQNSSIQLQSQPVPQSNKFLINLFKTQKTMFILALSWALLITSIDLVLKFIVSMDSTIRLYPQVVSFMCDFPINQQNTKCQLPVYIFWYAREAIILGAFLWSFYKSYELEEIDDQIRLKIQYFILISLPFLQMIVEKVFLIWRNQTSTAILVHYVACFSCLATGIILFFLHFNSAKDNELLLPDQSDLFGDEINLAFVFGRKDSRQTLKYFFQHKKKAQLFSMQLQLLNKDFNHLQYSQQKTNKIIKCLQQQNQAQFSRIQFQEVKFNRAKNKLQEEIKKLILQWKNTKSGKCLKKKWKKYADYYRIMKQLNLVSPIINPISGISDDSQHYLNNRLIQK